MVYNILGSSSEGNAVIYHKEVMVDCGVLFNKIKPIKNDLKLVLLTHRHKDHFLTSAINTLAKERPSLMWGVPKHMINYFNEYKIEIPLKNIVILEAGKIYKFGDYTIAPFDLYHDVENFGYRIVKNDYKIIHATDTKTLDGINAKGYDLYALEFNYDDETINDVILDKISKMEFSYEIRAIENHLSWQKAFKFFNDNKKETSKFIPLHISSRYSEEELKEAGVL